MSTVISHIDALRMIAPAGFYYFYFWYNAGGGTDLYSWQGG